MDCFPSVRLRQDVSKQIGMRIDDLLRRWLLLLLEYPILRLLAQSQIDSLAADLEAELAEKETAEKESAARIASLEYEKKALSFKKLLSLSEDFSL